MPAYNEQERIARTLQRYIDFFRTRDVEFIVVPNNCSDSTVSIVEEFVDAYPQLVKNHVIRENVGKGGAVLDGFRQASGELIGFVDADGSTAPEEFNKIIYGVHHYEGAIASRWKRGSKIINANIFREVVSIGFISVVKMLFWMPFIDTQCGAKLFRRNALMEVIDKVRTRDMAFDVDLLWRLHSSGCTVVEVPTAWLDNSASSTTLGSPLKLFTSAWHMLVSILKLRFS